LPSVATAAFVPTTFAGLITIEVDNFNGSALSSPLVANSTLYANPNGLSNPIFTGVSNGSFAVVMGAGVTGQARLSFSGLTLPQNYSSARILYDITFNNLGLSPQTLSGNGVENLIVANRDVSLPVGAVGSSQSLVWALFGNTLSFLDFQSVDSFGRNGSGAINPNVVNGWAVSIDNLRVQFVCPGVTNRTFAVSGTNSGSVAYNSSDLKSCPLFVEVPSPSSALLLLSGLFGVVGARRLKGLTDLNSKA
jgi:hypothetical protein